MLSASSSGTRSPLSPHTQSTLEKHLPGLNPKRFIQKKIASTADVACITGKKIYLKHRSYIDMRLWMLTLFYSQF